jgi:glycosyltransferase involved in cell wall biosynthesis
MSKKKSLYKSQNEYQYRMLIYPNITTDVDELWKDSYVKLLPYIINTLCKKYHKLHITYMLPKKLYNLKPRFSNQVDYLAYEVPSNPNKMRTSFSFDSNTFTKVTDYKNNPYDIVYTHLPEHTLQLSNLLFNDGISDGIRMIGYLHWAETPRANKGLMKRMLLMNFGGILECEEFGVNSDWLKEYLLKNAKDWFNDKKMDELTKILQVHQLGVEKIDFTPKKYRGKKILLWNHRVGSYTNFTMMCKAMSKLYKKRQDFEVHTTYKKANVSRYKWGRNVDYPTNEEYQKYLKDKVYLHLNTFKSYSAWSISTTDCLALGIPTITPTGLCYEEMLGDDYPLLYKQNNMDEFISKVEMILDSPKLRNQVVEKLKPRLNKMKWRQQILSTWIDWENLFDANQYPMVGKGTVKEKEATKKIREYKVINHYQLAKELKLGSLTKFGKTRNRLRLNPKIKFTKEGYEWLG